MVDHEKKQRNKCLTKRRADTHSKRADNSTGKSVKRRIGLDRIQQVEKKLHKCKWESKSRSRLNANLFKSLNYQLEKLSLPSSDS